MGAGVALDHSEVEAAPGVGGQAVDLAEVAVLGLYPQLRGGHLTAVRPQAQPHLPAERPQAVQQVTAAGRQSGVDRVTAGRGGQLLRPGQLRLRPLV